MEKEKFTAINEFRKYYFPESYRKKQEEEKINKMTPEEYGQYLARKSLAYLRENL